MEGVTCHLEPIIFQVRIFDNGKEMGSPFDWCCVATVISVDTVKISLAMQAPKFSFSRALCEKFKSLGFKRMIFERKKADRTTYKIVNLGGDKFHITSLPNGFSIDSTKVD